MCYSFCLLNGTWPISPRRNSDQSAQNSGSVSSSPGPSPKHISTPLDIPAQPQPTILSNGNPGSVNSNNNAAPSESVGNGALKDKLKPFDVDDMIQRLLDVGYTGKVSKSLCLKNAEVTAICLAARDVFLSQPTLIELSPPVKIVGDVHGQYSDLIRLFEMCGFPPTANYLFLGDYVDRGKQSLETILLLLCYKIKYPENFFLLRGNHECANVTRGEYFPPCPSSFYIFSPLLQCMVSMMNANDGVISKCGRRSSMCLTACQSLPSSLPRFSAYMVVSRLHYNQWKTSSAYNGRPMYRITDFSTICYGPTRLIPLSTGRTMNEGLASALEKGSSTNFWFVMTWT